MIRHLLTFLALCAGFAAIGTPAQAVQVVAAADQVTAAAATCATVAVARLIGAAPSARWVEEQSPPLLHPAAAACVPTIYLQADRAHE